MNIERINLNQNTYNYSNYINSKKNNQKYFNKSALEFSNANQTNEPIFTGKYKSSGLKSLWNTVINKFRSQKTPNLSLEDFIYYAVVKQSNELTLEPLIKPDRSTFKALWNTFYDKFKSQKTQILSIDDYNSLTDIQKESFRAKYKELEQDFGELNTLEKTHTYIANGIKKMFDKRFGENKYVIILIGRSLSTFGVSLEALLGKENLVNIPMSGASRFKTPVDSIDGYVDFTKKLEKDKGLVVFKDFLKDHNLSKEEVNKNDKSYILMDYCFQGNSLKGAEQLFKSEQIWGTDKQNVYAIDFMKLIRNLDESQLTKLINKSNESNDISKDSKGIFHSIQQRLCNIYFKQFSRVGEALYLEETYSATKTLYNEERNLVLFNLIDKIHNLENANSVIIDKNMSKKEGFIPPVLSQKVEIWQDAISAYESDLRNDINKIRKDLIKLKQQMNNDKGINLDIKETYDKNMLLYNKLCGYYSDLKNRVNMADYYKYKNNTK